MSVLSDDFFTDLKEIMPELPENVISLDIHLKTQEPVILDIVSYVEGKDLKPIVVDKSLQTETKRYKLVEIED